MNIQQIEISRDQSWDRNLLNLSNPHFMQSNPWGQFKSETGWDSNCLLYPTSNGNKKMALLIGKKIPILNKWLYYLPRGPQIDFADKENDINFLKQVKEYIQNNKGVFLRVDPYLEEDRKIDDIFLTAGFNKIKKKWSFWNSPKFVFWLELPPSQDQMFSALSTKIRTKIRYPYKKGVCFFKGNSDALIHFHELMKETSQVKGIGVHSFEYYKKLYHTLNNAGMVQLFFAKYKESYISTGMTVTFGNIAWLMYFASSKEHFSLRPNHALIWEMIKWACEHGCTRFDFRGTATDDPPKPQDPGYGVYEFKRSFGPRFVRTAGYYDYVAQPVYYRLFRLMEDYLVPGMWKGLNQATTFMQKLSVRR